jgi:hypothetical protein
MSFSQISKFGINFWNYLNEKRIGKGLNGAWAESGPWPRPFVPGDLRNGDTSAFWRDSPHRGGRPERCLAARTTRSVPWSPRVWHASGVITGDGSNGEVRRDAQNELQWVEADAPGNSLAAETHRGGTTPIRVEGKAAWWASDARRERMNRSTEEETGARVRLTRGRGGGGVSSQILWCSSAQAAPMGSRGRREAAKQL